ncbi:sensor histidine kinase [Paenibacillus yanchengensis]|uniref:Sensor histidine kinase n=1 Tax=Paenibacillus yanchengensis TaxID=2035833 RepID=A0ABW4YEU6_9BACL
MTKRIINMLMNRSLFTKIFISICIVAMIGIFGTAIIYQKYFKDILIDIEIDRVQRSINQSALNLDSQLSKIVNDMFYFFEYSDSGLDLLKADISQSKLTNDREEANKILEAFQMRYSGDVESVFFYRKDANGSEYFLHDPRFNRNPMIDYKAHQWYQIFQQKQHLLWTKPTRDHLFFQDVSQQTVYLTMSKYDVLDRDGIFVVRINAKMFRDAFRLLIGNDLYIELSDASGHLVYSSFPPKPSDDSENWLEMAALMEYSGYTVHAFANKQMLMEKVNKIGKVRFFVIVIVLIITLIISVILSMTLVKPIRTLLNLMKVVEKGDFNVRFPSKYKDEIGVLGLGFSKMVLRVSELIQRVYVVEIEKMESELRQKEATIIAMQNQINPHFLYNTLETVNCLAIVHRVPNITQVSTALADFFRYSIEKQQIEVTLQDELRHVETYLLIQKERYPEIEYHLAVATEALQYPIIKLVLQPLIENIYHHAFVGERDYFFQITGYMVDELSYVVEIEDNGEGMDEVALDQMMLMFEQVESPMMIDPSIKSKSARHGIGLLNVHTRIRLHYGVPYGLTLLHSVLGGLIVRLQLPRKPTNLQNKEE